MAEATEVKGMTSVEDSMKLRELEISSRYELKYLSDSFTDLRIYVKGKLDDEADKFAVLSKKVNWLMYVILLQLAGVDITLLTTLLKMFPV